MQKYLHQSLVTFTASSRRPPRGGWLEPESPLEPAPCRGTRTMVPSRIAHPKSASLTNAVKRRTKTPLLAQRRKRREHRVQGPETPAGRAMAPGQHDPRHRLDKQAVVRRRAPRISDRARGTRGDPLPLIITQYHLIQGHHPVGSLESHFRRHGNPRRL